MRLFMIATFCAYKVKVKYYQTKLSQKNKREDEINRHSPTFSSLFFKIFFIRASFSFFFFIFCFSASETVNWDFGRNPRYPLQLAAPHLHSFFSLPRLNNLISKVITKNKNKNGIFATDYVSKRCHATVLFLKPLRTSQVSSCFQGVQKETNGMKWIKGHIAIDNSLL